MKRAMAVAIVLLLALPSLAFPADMAAKLNAMLLNAKAEGHWQVKAAQVAQWVDEGREDFLVVDVRPNPGEFEAGHIPGAIYMSYNEVLKPENLERLPKDKMIILSCVTGQTQNLPVLALRALGYDARTMSFGHSAWIKGYYGGKLMKGAIQGAEENEYPLVK
jgi:rhodanese-related sulfurtransferase